MAHLRAYAIDFCSLLECYEALFYFIGVFADSLTFSFRKLALITSDSYEFFDSQYVHIEQLRIDDPEDIVYPKT